MVKYNKLNLNSLEQINQIMFFYMVLQKYKLHLLFLCDLYEAYKLKSPVSKKDKSKSVYCQKEVNFVNFQINIVKSQLVIMLIYGFFEESESVEIFQIPTITPLVLNGLTSSRDL